MPVDLSRVASKAIEAALEDGGQEHRRRGSAVKAVAAGAVLAVGARAAMSKAPGPVRFGLRHLPGMSGLRDMPERLRERMADAGWLDDDSDVDEPGAEVEDDFDEGDEPAAEADPDEEEPEDEPESDDPDDEEPYDEGEDDFEDDEDEDFEEDEEPEAEADEDFEEDDEEEEDTEPPELELESDDDEDLHPEDRPPRPPRSRSRSGR